MSDYTIDIDDTWGFYVDIEKENNDENIIKLHEKKYYKLTYLSDYCYEYESRPIDQNVTNLLIKVSSTTLATIGLTYLLICLL